MTNHIGKIASLLIGLISIAATSCSDEPEGSVKVYQNVVTFEGNQGRDMVLSYQEVNDSPVVTLTTSGNLDINTVAVGSRLIFSYRLPDGARYGEDSRAILVGLDWVKTATLTSVAPTELQSPMAPIYVHTLYRSGEYINLYCSLPNDPKREFSIRADESTIATATPHIYLSWASETATQSYDRNYMASFDISSVWLQPHVSSVIVHVNNSNNIYQTEFELKKQ